MSDTPLMQVKAIIANPIEAAKHIERLERDLAAAQAALAARTEQYDRLLELVGTYRKDLEEARAASRWKHPASSGPSDGGYTAAELGEMVLRLERERDAAVDELRLNATMLGKQCDLARVAEQEREEARAELRILRESTRITDRIAEDINESIAKERDEARAALREAIESFEQVGNSRYWQASEQTTTLQLWRKAAGEGA